MRTLLIIFIFFLGGCATTGTKQANQYIESMQNAAAELESCVSSAKSELGSDWDRHENIFLQPPDDQQSLRKKSINLPLNNEQKETAEKVWSRMKLCSLEYAESLKSISTQHYQVASEYIEKNEAIQVSALTSDQPIGRLNQRFSDAYAQTQAAWISAGNSLMTQYSRAHAAQVQRRKNAARAFGESMQQSAQQPRSTNPSTIRCSTVFGTTTCRSYPY